MNVSQVLVDGLYLLALINPVSKISVLSVHSSSINGHELATVVWRSSIVAFGLLLAIMACGDFVLRSIFHVDLQALRVAGGIVLLWVGFNALRRGVFFEDRTPANFADLAIVPLSCPMIAGPATIAACVTLAARRGLAEPAVSAMLAISANAVGMLLSTAISRVLVKFNVMGALIRITGLVVMTIGVQMVMDGLQQWVASLG